MRFLQDRQTGRHGSLFENRLHGIALVEQEGLHLPRSADVMRTAAGDNGQAKLQCWQNELVVALQDRRQE